MDQIMLAQHYIELRKDFAELRLEYYVSNPRRCWEQLRTECSPYTRETCDTT